MHVALSAPGGWQTEAHAYIGSSRRQASLPASRPPAPCTGARGKVDGPFDQRQLSHSLPYTALLSHIVTCTSGSLDLCASAWSSPTRVKLQALRGADQPNLGHSRVFGT